MQTIRVQDAVGSVLMHDLTQIIPGQSKGPRFRKGHIIQPEDIPVLLSMGKEHIYVWEQTPGLIHENEAAERLARAIGGDNIVFSEPKEGKVNLTADRDGLIYINEDALIELNSLYYVVIATLHSYRLVRAGEKIAGTRVVPLMVDEQIVLDAEAIAAQAKPVIEVRPLHPKKIGIVVTGSEVYHKRIEDKFSPVLVHKMKKWGSEVVSIAVADDNVEMIQARIKDALTEGAEIVLVTGGMSVDPDDVTPTAIRNLGGELVTYGAPVLPGAMFLLSYLNEVPIMGLPGCVMYAKTTVFDLIAPRILAGETITRADIARLGHGGLCLECEACTFPQCSFGK